MTRRLCSRSVLLRLSDELDHGQACLDDTVPLAVRHGNDTPDSIIEVTFGVLSWLADAGNLRHVDRDVSSARLVQVDEVSRDEEDEGVHGSSSLLLTSPHSSATAVKRPSVVRIRLVLPI